MYTFYPEPKQHVYTTTIRNSTNKKCGHECTACKNTAAFIFNVEVARVTRRERMSIAFFSRAPLLYKL